MVTPSPSATVAKGLVDRLRPYGMWGAALVAVLFALALALRLVALPLALAVHLLDAGADASSNTIQIIPTKQSRPRGKERS